MLPLLTKESFSLKIELTNLIEVVLVLFGRGTAVHFFDDRNFFVETGCRHLYVAKNKNARTVR